MKIILLLNLFLMTTTLIEAQTSTLAVFKNGTTFFVKKLKVDASTGTWRMKEIPKATFGTLWYTAQGNSIKSIGSFQEEITEKQDVESIFGTLKANIGKRAIISISTSVGNAEKTLDGTIEEVKNTLLLFKTNNQWLNIEPSNIKSVMLFEKPATMYDSKVSKRIIQLEFAKPNKEQSLEMMYLQKGITWVPSYAIDLLNDTKAKITLRATLLNDVEDLKNANLNFVVGVPNFAYSYLESPLTSNESVATFINTLNSNSNYYPTNRRSDITSQSLSNAMVQYNDDDEEEINFKGMDGQDAEDLFFYNLPNVTLPKGGRAFYDILQAEVDYQHIYEIEIKGNTENSNYSKDYTQEEASNEVFHSIRLKNDTKMPWTTGTALITKPINNQSNPLSQDKLSYIPVGGKGKLKITVAPNISVKHSEREVTRIEDQKKKDGYAYDLVTVEGKIELKNYKDKNIKLNIARKITGEAQKSNEKWEAKKLFDVYRGVNSFTQTEWEVDLAAGQGKEITYEYKIFVRR